MPWTRREFPALLAAAAAPPEKPRLATQVFPWDTLPVKQNGQNRSRAILDGTMHSGYPLEMHATELPAGGAPHGSHSHPNDELIVVREGTLEVNIAGRTSKIGPGSAVYVTSGEEHGVRNAGSTTAHYYIIALGAKK
jgi:mannose-6-phosphate isomerase-like protein (cupin superfamily)